MKQKNPELLIFFKNVLLNLFEGNVANEIGIGDWWDPSGPGTTYFRNQVVGNGIHFYDYSQQ